ncbi:TonB-dependent receptor [Parapedobacter sp. SGR-10]|uniref:TonB-dependent receptor n=1 Tax=Parapedobacter sp. SGR-10 TaxID=2710879 RepID=UPI0013D1946E|nr:TonB-dependent receptor [Parapedobacter sp. SGR-10]NGF57893.1 TonB-dependent receptor [Parapedobacter sp. SGR-10]
MYAKLVFFILILFPFYSFSQNGSLKAIIVDSAQAPIVGASVALLSSKTGAYLRGTQSLGKGQVSIDNISPGTYTFKVSYVGMSDIIRENIRIGAGKTLDMGTVTLIPIGKELGEVVVQGRLPDLQLDIDKKVFDVSQSMVSIGGTAEDVLGNVPTLQVDADGSVSLRGSTGVRILINGKESAMAGSDISKLLQSLPAEAVSKVEIMTNPSAKYDAEGQSGIVNIVLKKNVLTGFNGTVNASIGNYDNYTIGTSLNYRDNKFNYFGTYNFNNRNSFGESSVTNTQRIDGVVTDASEITHTHSETFRKGRNHSFRIGADYFATEKTNFSLGSNFSIRDNDRGADLLYRYINLPELGTESPRTSRQSEQDFGYDLTLDFRQALRRKGEEITANITFGDDREDGINDYLQTFDNGRFREERKNQTSERGKNWNFQLDYVLPLGDNHKFEAGYRTILRNSDESQYSDTLSQDGNFKPDFDVSNDFEMQSAVHALYVNYQRMLTERLGMQVGLRAEDAFLHTVYASLDPNVSTEPGNLDYFRVYPSAFLSYKVNKEGDKVQLSYTRRVQRPRGRQVNPFVNMSDATNLRQGNPELMPEDIHAIELGFAKTYEKWNFVTSAYYRRVNDMTQPIQYDIDDPIVEKYLEDKNATFSRWQNVGNRNSTGIEVVAKVNLFRWWDMTANVNMFYSNLIPYTEFDIARPENFAWNTNVTTNVRFNSTLSAQVKGDYRAPMKTLQGQMKSMSGVDLAVRQDVLKGKGSVVFNVRDVFDNRRFGIETLLPTRHIENDMRWSRRMFNLSFSYRFGTQDNSKNKRRNNMSSDDAGVEY